MTGAALPTPVIVPEPVREYRALQIAFQKRLRDRWQLFGNYVYSKLEGNYGGAIHEDTRFINPNFTEAFDSPQRAGEHFRTPPQRPHAPGEALRLV